MGGRGPRRDGGPRPPRDDRPPIKLPDLEVTFVPEERGVESLARQIKLSGRAYPLFEIGYLVLKKPERYNVQLNPKKDAEGKPIQPILICVLDDTLWIEEADAVAHVLDKHFGTFYATEKIPTDPPKGTYTFVAQCGMSGAILGPPNYHDYQNKLRRLHQERFSRMPFDAFKSRIKIVKDEAIVKKWLEDQSFRTEFTALNIPDTLKFNSREEVEKHFRETHLPNVIRSVDSHTIEGAEVAGLGSRPLQSLIRRNYDDQMRFPLKIVNVLSGQFARRGLQFFKVNKSITHVAAARPHFLDMEATPVSPGVQRIVEFINSHPRATRRQLIERLEPAAAALAAAQAAKPAPAPAPAPAPPAAEAAPAEGGVPAEGAAPAPEPAAPAPPPLPPEIQALNSDLHWLIHEGHVIEFANGILETAKRPAPRPVKPAKESKTEAAVEGTAEAAPEGEVTAHADAVSSEGAAAEAAGEPPADVTGAAPAQDASPAPETQNAGS